MPYLSSQEEKFKKQTAEWFAYFTNKYDTMLTNSHIAHFDIVPGVRCIDVDEIKESYIKEIEKELILWIKAEFESGDLSNITNWEFESEVNSITNMILCYKKKVFIYGKYYFELILINECEEFTTCPDCNTVNKRYIPTVHFSLAYYGWKEEGKIGLMPYDYII